MEVKRRAVSGKSPVLEYIDRSKGAVGSRLHVSAEELAVVAEAHADPAVVDVHAVICIDSVLCGEIVVDVAECGEEVIYLGLAAHAETGGADESGMVLGVSLQGLVDVAVAVHDLGLDASVNRKACAVGLVNLCRHCSR